MSLNGYTVKDVVTGFVGVVTGTVHYITGCNQCLVQPSATEDGKIPEGCWIDEQRLEVASEIPIVLDNGANPGFDKAPPIR